MLIWLTTKTEHCTRKKGKWTNKAGEGKKSKSSEGTRPLYPSSFHLLRHSFWAATQPAVNVHLILVVSYPGSSYEHMLLWPAVDLLPGAAATCPVVWCFASISLWLEPSGQSAGHSRVFECASVCKRSFICEICAATAETLCRQAVTQTKMDVQGNGNRHQAITQGWAFTLDPRGDRNRDNKQSKIQTVPMSRPINHPVSLLILNPPTFLRGEAKRWLKRLPGFC